MGLDEYKEVLFYLSTVINFAILLLSTCIYKAWKEKKLIIIIFITSIELIITQLKVRGMLNSVEYIDVVLVCIIASKILFLFMLSMKKIYKICKSILGIFLLSICIYVIFGWTNLGNQVFEIIINLCTIAFLSLNNIHKKYKENRLNKHKLFVNKKYINKTSKEIKKEIEIYNEIDEKNKIINEKLSNIIGVINNSIVIIRKSDYKCIFKNEYFDEFLLEHNYNEDNFEPYEFIKNILKKDPKKIFNDIKSMDFTKENFIIVDIGNKKYKTVVVRDYLDKEPIYILEIKDITELFAEENKLKRSELKYKTLMDILSDGVIIHDGVNVSYINKIALDIFKLDSSVNNVWTIDKIIKKISKVSQDDFKHNIFVLENDLKKEEKSKLELKNGRVVNIVSSSFLLNNKKMILTIISDFTEYEDALNKLEVNKKTYYTLLQTLPEGIVLLNRFTKKQVYVNKYMMRLLKDMGVDKFNQIIDLYIENKDNVSFKTFYVNEENHTKISIAIEQVPKQNNLLIIVRDLDIEQQMESVYHSLQIIKERNKFKTEFLTRASSNLKKPINTIFEVNKFLDSKQEVYNYEGIKSYTKTVKQNSYRLKRLLNNIEEITKIEAGVYYRDFKVYDIVKYLEKLVVLCSEYTKQKNINITFETNKREVLVYMDKEKIEKIILNILSNAIKFTERGGKIGVSLIVDKKTVIIAIKDTGSGIPSNKINFIFENFEQVNRSLSRTAEGTGVGLYLVKKLAQVHRAKVNVNSKIGCGSKFEIILKDNFLETTKENRKQVENIIIDREEIALEFSDIYLV